MVQKLQFMVKTNGNKNILIKLNNLNRFISVRTKQVRPIEIIALFQLRKTLRL